MRRFFAVFCTLLWLATGTLAQAQAIQFTPAYASLLAPTCSGASTTVNENTSSNPLTLSLGGGTATSVAVVSGPSNGSATPSGTTIDYTPSSNYSGSDSLVYSATNAAGTCSPTATASITVTQIPIGTPVEIGKSSASQSSSPQTLTTTTINDAPAGGTNLIIATSVTNGAWSPSYNNDSAGNSYGLLGFNQNTVDLPSGGSFSVTWTLSLGSPGGSFYQAAYSISGLVTSGGYDASGSGSGTGTSPSATESTPSGSHRIVFGYVTVTGGASDSFTEASGWTTAPGSPVTLSGKDALHVAYRIVTSSVSPLTYNPTLGTSRTWSANVISFDGF